MSDVILRPPRADNAGGAAVLVRLDGLVPTSGATPAPDRRREEVAALASLVLVLLADLAVLRVGLDAEDEGYFVEQATRVVRGQIPFRDFDSLYTPALLYLHAAVLQFFGGSPVVDLRLVGWVARVVFALALYLICRPMVRPAIAALPSLFTLIALDRLPSTWEPHPGWPSAALSIVAVGLAMRLPKTRQSLSLVGIGALAAVVFALKQNAGVMLGLALVVGAAWQGLDPDTTEVTRGLRRVQFALLGLVVAATSVLLLPHAAPLLLAYFLGPLLAAGLAAILTVRVSASGRTVGAWLRVVLWLGFGWSIVTIPWVVALGTALDWNLLPLKGFVGLVNQDPLWFPLAAPDVASAGLLGIGAALLGITFYRKRPMLQMAAAVVLLVFAWCMFQITRGPDDSWLAAALLAPGRASEGLALYLPAVCIAGGVWLSAQTRSRREAWWLRWMSVASAVTFLTQYPRVDEVHLTWSASLPLATGAVVLPHVYAGLVKRWRAGATRYLVAVALVLVPVAIGLDNLGVRSAGFVDFSSGSWSPFGLASAVDVTDVAAASGFVIPSRQNATLLAAVRFVDANTALDEPIFVYPTSPLVYVLADRPNPTRFDHLYPGAATAAELEAIMATLEQEHVNMVVVSESDLAFWGAPLENAALEDFLASTYHEVAEFGGYRVLRRR